MSEKKCPLMLMSSERVNGDCLESECALWDNTKQQCSVKSIAKALQLMQIVIENGGDQE